MKLAITNLLRTTYYNKVDPDRANSCRSLQSGARLDAWRRRATNAFREATWLMSKVFGDQEPRRGEDGYLDPLASGNRSTCLVMC